MSRSGGLPFTLDGPWADGGMANVAFHNGGIAAERAFAKDAQFCLDPVADAGEHRGMVIRFLRKLR